MSDSKKLRKIYGSIWLTASLVSFALAVCGIWSMFVTSLGTFIMLFGIVPLFFFVFSLIGTINSYETYVGVNEEEIRRFYAAKLLKTNGILALFGAFLSLASAISFIWLLFVFSNTLGPIFPIICMVIWVLVALFVYFIQAPCRNFMAIEEIVLDR